MKKENVPQLRFREFKNEWNTLSLGEIIEVKSGAGFNASEYVQNGIRLLQIENVSYGRIEWTGKENYLPKSYLNEYSDLSLKSGDVVLALNRPVTNNKLKIALLSDLDEPSILYQRVGKIIIKSDFIVPEFLFQIFIRYIKIFVLRQSIGSDQPYISLKALYNYKVPLANKEEQQKIASFLSAVDKKIRQLRRKKELLEEYKKGVMQKLFPPAGGQAPEIRFKDENGEDFPDWEVKTFGEIFERITRKNEEDNQNVLTISAQDGLINQEDYFNRSVAAKDLTRYYLLNKGEFAYNKSYSNGYPLGAIKRLKRYKKGVVSTLYICFKVKGDNSPEFYEEFLDNGGINHEIYKIAQEGSRNHGLLNVSVIDFFKDIKVPRPSFEEQNRIAEFLASINKKKFALAKRLEKTEEFKKGLLQQMFI